MRGFPSSVPGSKMNDVFRSSYKSTPNEVVFSAHVVFISVHSSFRMHVGMAMLARRSRLCVDNAPTMCKQHHVKKIRQRHRDLSESRKGRARIVKKNFPLDQTALLMSAHHVATDLHMCQQKHQQHQSPVSATTQCRHPQNRVHLSTTSSRQEAE